MTLKKAMILSHLEENNFFDFFMILQIEYVYFQEKITVTVKRPSATDIILSKILIFCEWDFLILTGSTFGNNFDELH